MAEVTFLIAAPHSPAPVRGRCAIIAILNCYAPAGGRNISQIVLRSNGEAEILGDDADLARSAMRALINSRVPLASETRLPWNAAPCSLPTRSRGHAATDFRKSVIRNPQSAIE